MDVDSWKSEAPVERQIMGKSDEFSFAHAEFQMPMGHLGGNV